MFHNITRIGVFFAILLAAPFAHAAPSNYPSIHADNTVEAIYAHFNSSRMTQNLKDLCALPDRHMDTVSGVKAVSLIAKTLKSYEKAFNSGTSGKNLNVDITEFVHKTWNQNSIIARIGGSKDDRASDDPVTILACHLDSWGKANGSKEFPAADYDGSGVVALMEIFATILENKYVPQTPLEFHWYSGQSGGDTKYAMLGSNEIAHKYHTEKISVSALVNMDTIGVPDTTSPTIAAILDDSNPQLVTYIGSLVDRYIKVPFHQATKNSKSDDYPWSLYGFPTVWLHESETFGAWSGTTNDTIDRIKMEHVARFVKLGTAVAVELTTPGFFSSHGFEHFLIFALLAFALYFIFGTMYNVLYNNKPMALASLPHFALWHRLCCSFSFCPYSLREAQANDYLNMMEVEQDDVMNSYMPPLIPSDDETR
eukprot:25049_1